MPPLRRYLRITPHSVLETRIYLDNPLDIPRWLLSPSNPILPRVLEAVRPLVLPKLREENEKAKGKGKKKGVKDVVVEDEFEVSVFLTEISTRHAILKKEKVFRKEKGRLGRVGGRMTGEGTREGPVIVEEEREERRLEDIPSVEREADDGEERRGSEGLFVSDEEEAGEMRRGKGKEVEEEGDGDDDKKKMALKTLYDGFDIYGRILCLVVKRRGVVKGKQLVGGAGQAMMEDWITSTQMGIGGMADE